LKKFVIETRTLVQLYFFDCPVLAHGRRIEEVDVDVDVEGF
jgi:hypothetical protein